MTLNPQSTQFDAAIQAAAQALFGATPRLQKCPSEVNYCALLSFDDGRADRVIKMVNRDPRGLEIERQLYPAMAAAGLPVPEIEFSQLDYPAAETNFIVMPKFSDHALREFCRSDRGATASAACRASGEFIHQLHQRFSAAFATFCADPDLGPALAINQGGADRELDLDGLAGQDSPLAPLIEEHLAALPKPAAKHLTHGQPHNKNILADEQGNICVIDVGQTIGLASPLRDLYTLLVSHDGWLKGIGDPAQRAAIIAGYGGLDQEQERELRYWEFAYWLKALQDYQGFAADPNNDSQFVQDQLRTIGATIDKIAAGNGLVDAL